MKKFLIESVVFLSFIFISLFIVFIKADGNMDPFYIRFTTPRQHSLIIGTSRAAQGIRPDVLNNLLDRNDLFNYSFTITSSPYGPTYLNSIKMKLDPDAKDGIFILAVDPWSISSSFRNPNDTSRFREASHILGKMTCVNVWPNAQYFLKAYDEPLFNVIYNPSPMFLHDDGWLEVSVKLDSARMLKNVKKKVEEYRKTNLLIYHFSDVRLAYLIKTIEFLKGHGSIYLVRLPVHPAMMEVDEELMPDFDKKMLRVSEQTAIPYLDLTWMNNQILFTDGNHIYKESGAEVTRVIADWILDLQRSGYNNESI